MARLLTIPQQANEALGPAQRKFNQLQAQIDKTRKALLTWDEALPAFSEAFAKQVVPLRREAAQLRRDTALRIDGWLGEKGWARGEREMLEHLVCELAREVIEEHGLDPIEQGRWKALHDRYSPISFDAENAHGVEVLKRMFEKQTGLDLSDEDFEDEDALLRHVREKLLKDREEAPPPAPKPKRLSAAQQKRQDEREAVQAQAKQTLREVFRKLASSLHPDRATDDEDSVRRTALMQRANAAYAKEDLLALLSLQLEIEQIDAAHLRGATDAQLKHFNAVLQEQLEELKAEVQMRERSFCADFEIKPRSTSLNPAKLGPVLAHAVADWRAEVFHAGRDYEAVNSREGTRKWLKKVKAEALFG
ncbi:MAG: hypothetical protein ACK5O3_15230 [Burkholderiales bacterium]